MKSLTLKLSGILKYRHGQDNVLWKDAKSIKANVPGNIEIDLMEAGILPDIFYADNILKLKEYEFYDWQYELKFNAPKIDENETAYLNFGGVDCFANYYLNGKYLGHTENALIEHKFPVTELIKEGENSLTVEILSPILEAYKKNHDIGGESAQIINYESLWVRKAPSQYGWDIMPRAILGGIWRDVKLDIEGENEIHDLYLATTRAYSGSAEVRMAYSLKTNVRNFEKLAIRVEFTSPLGRKTEAWHTVRFTSGSFPVYIQEPELWWPHGYGKANLYDVNITFWHNGKILDERNMKFGIRKAKLIKTDTLREKEGGEFVFELNGHKIMCKGSNWVPCDALHSRDKERYEKNLELFRDTECNILRCWGGNVYEDHEFFDYCDKYGIMVWHDFSFACAKYPYDDEFLTEIKKEIESVVKKLRNHASIVLWSGDNECDAAIFWQSDFDPGQNRITREVMPDVIYRLDPHRAFMPSSPYVSKAAYDLWQKEGCKGWPDFIPEDHLWGPRDYFKTPYYADNHQKFISETGYHGCSSVSSIKSFISPDKAWSYKDNEEWIVHAAEMTGKNGPYAYRIELMAKQIKQLFGYVPDNLSDFVLASQISQAEADKYFIENTRQDKWGHTGIIWWNMIDGWPQFSDAVVSYDYIKKLAYYFIKQAQQPIDFMLGKFENWQCPLYVCNDTLNASRGRYKLYDGETGEIIREGEYYVSANSNARVCSFDVYFSEKSLLITEWEENGVKHYNHGILGTPEFSLEKYKEWLKILGELYGFDTDKVIG